MELIVLAGGRRGGEDLRSSAPLRLVRASAGGDLQAALEETVAAARAVRRDIEQRIARALEDLARTRAPDSAPP